MAQIRTALARVEMTHELAHRIGQDAGNQSMRQAGRTAWNEEDYNRAAEMFQELMGEARWVDQPAADGAGE